MNAGRLKEVITIQKPTISQNEYGANGTQWTDYITTRSDVQFESGNRDTENGEIVFNYTKIFTIRYYHNIDEKDRTRIQQASAKLRNVFVKALLWC